MGMEDLDFAANGTVSKVTDYGIGPRGIDAMYVTQSGATSVNYPLYDAHGNMISTLNKQGTGGYAYSALRTFDAWGLIRRGAATGDPKGRYCASLGHKQDDESGLTYMRARYYEPTSGRFISEDPSRNGGDWFSYCSKKPVSCADRDGNASFNQADLPTAEGLIALFYIAIAGATLNACIGTNPAATLTRIGIAAGFAALALGCTSLNGFQQALIASPTILSGFIMLGTQLGWLAKNPWTSVIAGLITAQVVVDYAALLYCS